MPDSAARLSPFDNGLGEFDEELGLEVLESAVGIGAAGDAFNRVGAVKFSSDFGVILKFVEVGADELVGGAGASFGCLQGGPFSGFP